MSIISLKDYKEKKAQDHMVVKCDPEAVQPEVPAEPELSMEEIIERNKKNKERVEKERAKDNKSVKRQYRLEDK